MKASKPTPKPLPAPTRPMTPAAAEAFYNEIDPGASAWLDQLMADGHITNGQIDSRDIRDIAPADIGLYKRVHLFAGIGGWDYALKLANWPPNLGIWTASCPCQPFSQSGGRAGATDERHLFPAVHWLVRFCRPSIIVGEQVASGLGLEWFDTVSARLESDNYSVAAFDLPAASVGAPHIRQRQYWVAYTNDQGQRSNCRAIRDKWHNTSRSSAACGLGDSEITRAEQREVGLHSIFNNTSALGDRFVSGCSGCTRRGAGCELENANPWNETDWVACTDGKIRPIEPGIMPLAHGVPARVVRIRGYGNAIVPQVAAMFLTAVLDSL